MARSEEFLNEIRKINGLERAVLKKITVEGTAAVFFLITDKSYTQNDIVFAKTIAQKYVAEGLSADVSVMKSVPDEEGVRREIADLLKDRFPSAAAFVSPDDISVSFSEGNGRFSIGVMPSERGQFDRSNALDVLTEELNRRFCGVWHGDFYRAEKETGEIEFTAPPLEQEFTPRVFEIKKYSPIDGANPRYAVYLSDLEKEAQNITVCGELTYWAERKTKNDKPYFTFSISDGSGQLRASYFTKKTTLEKVRAVKQGDFVCVTGNYELYNGSMSFAAKQIDYGSPPEGFVPEARPSRPVPAEYQAVFPERISDYVQSDLFDQTNVPPVLRAKTFVVFDLETTGLNSSPAGGVMDHIIEIGAVKIQGGSIVEKFSSFVACPVRLSEKIIELTGITDDMLVGAPEVGTVLADFYKFCAGAELVGHNVQFDLGFIRYYGEKAGYMFHHRNYDTYAMAQRDLFLKNYKLNTIADYFGFTFQHHRAFDDAFVTAKIFIELVKRRGGLD